MRIDPLTPALLSILSFIQLGLIYFIRPFSETANNYAIIAMLATGIGFGIITLWMTKRG
jgi:hypothetical protein